MYNFCFLLDWVRDHITMFESSQYLTSESFGGLNKTLDERHAALSMAWVCGRSLLGLRVRISKVAKCLFFSFVVFF
jgi:hypothetical protein